MVPPHRWRLLGRPSILEGPPESFSTEESVSGATCLWMAASLGHAAVVGLLLAAGADTSQRYSGKDPSVAADRRFRMYSDEDSLLAAARDGHSAVVHVLLTEPTTVDVNARNGSDETALYLAARHDHADVVGRLLAAGAIDVNARRRSEGSTPLYAALIGNKSLAAGVLLADSRVDVAACDRYGRTPLFFAAGAGHAGHVATILRSKAVHVSVSALMPRRYSPLIAALSHGRAEAAKVLLADPRMDVAAHRLTDLLVDVAQAGHAEVVALLLGLPEVDVAAVGRDSFLAAVCRGSGSGDTVRHLLIDPRVILSNANYATHCCSRHGNGIRALSPRSLLSAQTYCPASPFALRHVCLTLATWRRCILCPSSGLLSMASRA